MWFSNFFSQGIHSLYIFCSFALLCFCTFLPKELPYKKGLQLLEGAFFFYMLAAFADMFENFFFDLGISPSIFVFTRLCVCLCATLFMLAAATSIWRGAPLQQEFVFIFTSAFLLGAWLEIFVFNEARVLTLWENLLFVLGLLFVCMAFVFKNPLFSVRAFLGVVLGSFAFVLCFCGIYHIDANLILSAFFVGLSLLTQLLRIEALEKQKIMNEDVLARTVFNLEQTPLPTLIARAENGVLLAANSAALQLFYLSANELWRYHFQDMFVDEKAYESFMAKLKMDKHAQAEILAKATGEFSPFWLNGVANEAFYRGEKVIYAVFVEQIISKKIEDFMNRKNHLDLLTGVFHQAYFKKTVAAQIKQAQKQHDFSSVMLVDVDGFEQINNDFGTLIGDRVLMEIAGLICKHFEQTGVVGRVGADEFAVYFRGVEANQLETMALMLLAQVHKLKILTSKGTALAVSLSAGLAVGKNDDYDCVYQKALRALNFAKENGGKQSVLYKPSLVQKGSVKRRVVQKIHPALAKEEIKEVSLLDDGGFMGFEG